MNITSQTARRFKEVILDGTWVSNTNYKNQLTGLDWSIAIAKINSFNSIAQLAQHIHYYIKGVLNVLKGGSLDIRDKYSFDFPPIQSQEEWENFLQLLWGDAEEFASLIEQMPEKKLLSVFVEEKYGSYLRNIDGLIEHSYYHLGKIVLLKKLLLQNEHI